jgi:hypothetical protein
MEVFSDIVGGMGGFSKSKVREVYKCTDLAVSETLSIRSQWGCLRKGVVHKGKRAGQPALGLRSGWSGGVVSCLVDSTESPSQGKIKERLLRVTVG